MSGASLIRITTVPWAVAFALPFVLTATSVPDAVFYHQVAAVGVWGAWVLCGPGRVNARGGVAAALMALGVCASAVLMSGAGFQGAVLPVLLAAAVVLASAAGGVAHQTVTTVALGLWLAGIASAWVALIQYFAPGWSDTMLVASSGAVGRAVGNMRQPNHLATALLCATVWTVWLWQVRVLAGQVAAASIVAMLLALVTTASRTGAVSLAILLVWACVDRRLPRGARTLLVVAPLVYVLDWALLAGHAAWQHGHFYGSERLQSSGDVSSSRFAIWRNALALLAAHPWAGVGWGNFNAAWTFSAFPDRPVAFFDHTHNLVLQLAVELGVPIAGTVIGLLVWALWHARSAWSRGKGDASARAALMMIAVLAMHSMLEYPLWYAYFLLPGAWALGVFLGAAATGSGAADGTRWRVRVFGAAMLLGAFWAVAEHRRVEAIFAPSSINSPLSQRIAEGQRSVLFGHHADYAAVTTPPRDTDLETFRRPLHQLIDVRLLRAYAEALRVNGHDAEALYAAQRLREFRRADAQAWFKDCDGPEPPWQCDTRPVLLDWRDLMP